MTANQELLALDEGDDDDGVQVEALTEHPEEVTGHKVLSDGVQRLCSCLPRSQGKSALRKRALENLGGLTGVPGFGAFRWHGSDSFTLMTLSV